MNLSSLFRHDFIATVFGSIIDPLRIVDSDFRLLWTNRGQSDEIGHICFELFGYDAPCNDCPVVPVMHTGRTYVREKQLVAQDGSIRWNEIRAYPIFDKDDEVHLMVTIGRDITDRKMTKSVTKAQSKDSAIRLTGRQAEVLKLVAD